MKGVDSLDVPTGSGEGGREEGEEREKRKMEEKEGKKEGSEGIIITVRFSGSEGERGRVLRLERGKVSHVRTRRSLPHSPV